MFWSFGLVPVTLSFMMKSVPLIRSFHPSALRNGVLSQTGCPYSPLCRTEPKCVDAWWAIYESGYAGVEVGVGVMRVTSTFHWMSDSLLFYLLLLLTVINIEANDVYRALASFTSLLHFVNVA